MPMTNINNVVEGRGYENWKFYVNTESRHGMFIFLTLFDVNGYKIRCVAYPNSVEHLNRLDNEIQLYSVIRFSVKSRYLS